MISSTTPSQYTKSFSNDSEAEFVPGAGEVVFMQGHFYPLMLLPLAFGLLSLLYY